MSHASNALSRVKVTVIERLHLLETDQLVLDDALRSPALALSDIRCVTVTCCLVHTLNLALPRGRPRGRPRGHSHLICDLFTPTALG